MPVYRTIQVDTLDALRDVTVQAERAYLRLALGRFSTRTGIVKYNARDLASEARLRPSELEAALAELERSGHILRAENAPAVYLLGFCSAFAPRPVDNRRSWLVELGGCKYANLAAQAMKEIEDAQATGGPVGPRRGAGGYPVAPLQEQEQEQEQNRINSTPLPTVATPTGATAPSKERKEKTAQAPDPAADLIALYHEACPSLARSQGKPVTLKACAIAIRRESDLSAWKERFRRAELSDFLTGRSGNDRPFKADLLWILNPTNAEKIDAGRYDNRGKPGMMTHAGTYKPTEPETIWPFYASNGKGLNAPEFIHPTLGPTEMTREEFDADQAKLPVYMRAPPC